MSRIVASQGVPREEHDAVVQDVFVRAYFSLRTFDSTRYFEPWISGIAFRASKDFFRTRTRQRMEVDMSSLLDEEFATFDIAAEASSDPAQAMDTKALRTAVLSAVDRLGDEQRLAILLFYFEGMSVRDIADATDWTASKVKVTLYRARRVLRHGLDSIIQE